MLAERNLETQNYKFEPWTRFDEPFTDLSGSGEPIEESPNRHHDASTMPEILQQHNVPHELYERTCEAMNEIKEQRDRSFQCHLRKEVAWTWILSVVLFAIYCLGSAMMFADTDVSDFKYLVFFALYSVSVALLCFWTVNIFRQLSRERQHLMDGANDAFKALSERESAVYERYGVKVGCVFAERVTIFRQQDKSARVTQKEKEFIRFNFVETEMHLEREELEKITDLFREGALTEEEFEQATQLVKKSNRGKQKEDILLSCENDMFHCSATKTYVITFTPGPAEEIV